MNKLRILIRHKSYHLPEHLAVCSHNYNCNRILFNHAIALRLIDSLVCDAVKIMIIRTNSPAVSAQLFYLRKLLPYFLHLRSINKGSLDFLHFFTKLIQK